MPQNIPKNQRRTRAFILIFQIFTQLFSLKIIDQNLQPVSALSARISKKNSARERACGPPDQRCVHARAGVALTTNYPVVNWVIGP